MELKKLEDHEPKCLTCGGTSNLYHLTNSIDGSTHTYLCANSIKELKVLIDKIAETW